MSDEYRQTLARWAVENLPPNLKVQRITEVGIDWDEGSPGWSTYTPGEEPSFTISVHYLDALGRKERWETDNAIPLSRLLRDLFRLADITEADFAAANARRRAEAEQAEREAKEQAAWAAKCRENAQVALFSGGGNITGWQLKRQGFVIIPAGWTGTVHEMAFSLDNGELARIPFEFEVTNPQLPKKIDVTAINLEGNTPGASVTVRSLGETG